MRLRWIRFRNFRGFRQAHFSLDAPRIFLHGPNGSGKTTLLEGIVLVCGDRLPHPLAELISAGASYLEIEALCRRHTSQWEHLRYFYDRKQGSLLQWNHKTVPSLRRFYGTFPVWLITPAVSFWASGPPEERRRTIDRLLALVYPEYRELLSYYMQILEARNTLLRQTFHPEPKQPPPSPHQQQHERLLIHYTRYLQAKGKQIQAYRQQLTQAIQSRLTAIWQALFGPSNKTLTLQYVPANLDQWEEKIPREKEVGYSLTGIQRDDWQIHVVLGRETHSARYALSRGEKIRAGLGVMLALWQWVKSFPRFQKNPPVVLVDDWDAFQDRQALHTLGQWLSRSLDQDVQVIVTGQTSPPGHWHKITLPQNVRNPEQTFSVSPKKAHQP